MSTNSNDDDDADNEMEEFLEPSNPIMDEFIHRLYKARCTMRTMMRARSYVPMQEQWDQDPQTFLQTHNTMSNYTALTIRAWKGETLLLAFFPSDSKLRVTVVREICEYAEQCRCNHFIIVYADTITPFTKTTIANYKADHNCRIETFSTNQLQYNITEHNLVPPHRLLEPAEQEEVLKRMQVTPAQLPKIFTSDPVVKWYGARVGQVMEITRPSPDGHFYKAHRVVIKGTYKRT